MPDVYVANHGGFNYDPARQFGTLVFMSKGFIVSSTLDDTFKRFKELINSSSPTDYLLLSGSSLICSIALHLWISKHGKCNVIHWAGQEYQVYNYEPT